MLAAVICPAGVRPAAVTADIPGTGEESPAPEQPPGAAGLGELLGPQEMVVDVQVVGNRNIRRERIAPLIRTRPNRPFDPQVVEEDVRRLMRSKLFSSVRPLYKRQPNGRVVIFEVVERATIQDVLYVGNEQIRKKTLAKEAGIKPGDAMDPFGVEEARKSIENYYHRKGFTAARVSVLEGDRPGDTRVVFLINEGRKQKVLWVRFVGNTIASDARLRTVIQDKTSFLYL
jgi:outer membrane protein insertion porin family